MTFLQSPYAPPMHPLHTPYVPLCAMNFLYSDPTRPLRAPMYNDLFLLRPYVPPTCPYVQ